MTDPFVTLGTLLKLLVIWVCILALELAHILVTATKRLVPAYRTDDTGKEAPSDNRSVPVTTCGPGAPRSPRPVSSVRTHA